MKRPEIQEKVAVKSTSENPSKEEIKKMTREEVQDLINRMQARDAELVTGIFRNFETPASSDTRGAVRFVYGAYKGDGLPAYELWDGVRYSLPRGLVRRIKKECYVPEYERVQDPVGGQQGILQAHSDGRLRTTQNEMRIVRKRHRFGFSILDYMDMELESDLMPSPILEVTY